MLAGAPLALAGNLDAGAVDQKMEGTRARALSSSGAVNRHNGRVTRLGLQQTPVL